MVAKHKKHPAHHGGQPSVSYFTDDAMAFDSEAAMATLAAAPAPPPTRTNEELNLAVLQRHYPAVSGILSIANFATLYTLHPQTQAWDKANCDGTLFVCALQSTARQAERYALVILNRRELKNFYLELLSPNMVEFEEPFVMLKDENDDVSGLFISAEPAPASTAQMREINVGVIQECAARAEESRASGVQQWGGMATKGQDGMQEEVLSTQQDSDYGYSQDVHQANAPLVQQQQQQQHQKSQYQAHQGHLAQLQPQQQSWPLQHHQQQHQYAPLQHQQYHQHQQQHPQQRFPQQQPYPPPPQRHQYPHQQPYPQQFPLHQQQQHTVGPTPQGAPPPPQAAAPPATEHDLLRLFARAKAGL